MYKAGLCSVSFRKNSPDEILSACKNAGLSYIEWGSDIHAPESDESKLIEIAELQAKYNIKCSSYGSYFRIGQNSIDELQKYIRSAKILGTKIIRIWCGTKGSSEYSNEETEILINECISTAKIAEENDVILCLECHVWTYTDSLQSALYVMKKVNKSSFRMYWQPNQFSKEENNLEYAEGISQYITNIHVFNWEGSVKKPLGQGLDVWKKYLEKTGDDKTLLLEFMPDDSITSLKEEAASLLKLISEQEE